MQLHGVPGHLRGAGRRGKAESLLLSFRPQLRSGGDDLIIWWAKSGSGHLSDKIPSSYVYTSPADLVMALF